MTNLEKYKDNIVEYYFKLTMGCMIHRLRRGDDCKIDNCRACYKNSLNWLSEEYQEPKIKLTKMEYDLLRLYSGIYSTFNGEEILILMRQKGYFKDVKDTSMIVSDILANCEVVDYGK